MSKTLTLTLTTEERDMPQPGRTPAGFRFRLRAASGNEAAIDTPEVTVQFPGVTEGATYTAICEALDDTGAVVGNPVEISITIPAVAAKYMAPVGLSWSVD